MNDDKTIFIEVVQADASLPVAYRERAAEVKGLDRSVFDQSYLDFLREKIAMEPRGPEWTEILKGRLAALAPCFSDSSLHRPGWLRSTWIPSPGGSSITKKMNRPPMPE
jgi:hypothetical protein